MEEWSVLLIGYLGSCDSNREGLHFTPWHTCEVKLLAALCVLHGTRVHSDGEPQKIHRGQGFAPLASPGKPRWESSSDGKQQSWDAQRKPLIPTFTGKLRISVKLSFISLVWLLLFGGDLFFLCSLCLFLRGRIWGGQGRLWEGRAALRPWRGNTPAPFQADISWEISNNR